MLLGKENLGSLGGIAISNGTLTKLNLTSGDPILPAMTSLSTDLELDGMILGRRRAVVLKKVI
jgi:hypothetical protein